MVAHGMLIPCTCHALRHVSHAAKSDSWPNAAVVCAWTRLVRRMVHAGFVGKCMLSLLQGFCVCLQTVHVILQCMLFDGGTWHADTMYMPCIAACEPCSQV